MRRVQPRDRGNGGSTNTATRINQATLPSAGTPGDPKQHLEMMNKMIKYMAEKAQKGKDW